MTARSAPAPCRISRRPSSVARAFVCVDPRRTMTSRQLADEHIFIRPSHRCRRADRHGLCHRVAKGLHDQAYCDRHVLGFDEAPAGCAGRPIGPICLACRRHAEDAGMGGGDHRHSGRDAAASGDRVRHHEAGRVADWLCARPHRRMASSSIAPPTRWPRSPAMSASSAAIPASATAPPGGAASAACRSAVTRSSPCGDRRCWPTCWHAARRAAIRPTSS